MKSMFSRRTRYTHSVFRGTKRLNGEQEVGEVSKRRRKTPGFTPFKQVEIPASWKMESRKLREAVRISVAHCHYDDPSKRERLGNAVFEALSGQKTMKAAATLHEVPFTTLQTYFHRSRARMAKIMSDSDNALPEQIQIPVSLTLSTLNMGDALAKEKMSLAKSKKSRRLDSLLNVLMGKVVESGAWINGTPSSSDFAPQKLGSSKRKPKKVHRITPVSAVTTANESLEGDRELSGWCTNQSQNPVKDITAKSNEVTSKYSKEEVLAIIKSVISDSSLDENTKNLVKRILDGILDKSLSADDMCTFLRLEPSLMGSNIYRVEQVMKFPYISLNKDETDFQKSVENKSQMLYLSPESQDCECLDEIEKCVNDVCRFSHYPALQKEALRKAVSMVIRGEYSVSGAASIMNLPTSTVHPYVHRARTVLETFLPQQPKTNRETAADEYGLYNTSVSRDVKIVISYLMKISPYDLVGQQKLHDALSEVLMKDVPVAEVCSKYGIAVDAFQSYITKARMLLGQSPYPTSSNTSNNREAVELGVNLSDHAEEHAGDDDYNKIFGDTGPLLRNISARDAVVSAAVAVYPNVVKSLFNYEKQCDDRNLSVETGKKMESITDKSPTEDLLSPALGVLINSDEFDYDKHNKPNIAKIRPSQGRRIENVNATSHEGESPTKNITVSCGESGSDDGDNEFDGLPRSIRGVAKLLSDTKLDKLSTKDYTGTPENLALKIDKVLRQYRFRGDRQKMRDGILEVLYKSKTLSEACKGNSLAPTTLSTYVRLVKVLINTEKTGTKGLVRDLSLPNPIKLIKNESDRSSNLALKNELVNSEFSMASAEKDAERGVVTTVSTSSKVTLVDAENGVDCAILSNNLSDNTCFEQMTKKQNLPAVSSSSAEEDTKIGTNLLIQNVDVMMLHTKSIMSNLESFYKVLIAYLIEQQYRRSEEAQEKMRASLEYVLLDGLSVTEALKIHNGPTEHVLQVYLSRCRKANRCIKTEFSNFKSSVARALNKNCMENKQSVEEAGSTVQINSNTAAVTKNYTVKRSSKRLQKREDDESTVGTVPTVGTLKHLDLIFSEDFRKPLYDYLKKLSRVNFPIEDTLIVGLAKMIIDEFPVNQKIFFADAVWEQWLAGYRKEHPEFEE
uniref:Uncharacterized protein n=1 Tax=Setaria digitata TaxID=48799 RepID=A0A915Q6M1_9BILA